MGLSLRALHAAGVSFHLDDFHSLYHAQNTDTSSFWSRLLEDNHPPLSFLVLAAFRFLGGENPLWLRTPNLIYAGLSFFLTWRIAKDLHSALPNARARNVSLWGPAFLALSSLHIELTTDLRMYGLLALASTGLFHALLRALQGRGRAQPRGLSVWLPIALWTGVGLHTHYHFVHVLALLSPLSAFLFWRAQRLRCLLLGLGAGVLLSLPWYVLCFPQQLGHGLAPGGSTVTLKTLLEGLAHLIFFRVSLAPEPLHTLLIGASVAAFLGAVFGVFSLWRLSLSEPEDKQTTPQRSALYLFATLAFLLPAWTALVAYLIPRAGYEWRYLAAAIAPFCLLFAQVASSRYGKLLATGVLIAALVNAGLVVRAPGREDYLNAARFLESQYRSGDGLLAADWQPRIFPHGIGWRYYGERVSDGRAKDWPQLEHTKDFQLARPKALEKHPRVLCILRSIPGHMPFLKRLRETYRKEESHAFGTSVFVLIFSNEP